MCFCLSECVGMCWNWFLNAVFSGLGRGGVWLFGGGLRELPMINILGAGVFGCGGV